MIPAGSADHGSDPRPLVHDFGQHGQGFVEVNARDIGANGPECAANLLGGIGLGVDQVLMRRSPRHVDHDHGLVGGADFLQFFGPQKFRQGQATGSN